MSPAEEIDPSAFRRLTLEGPVNFRDLGGYETDDGRTVRRRHLFRSDALFRLTDADVEQVRALGVTTLIDFRTLHELEENGWGGMETLGVEHVHLPTIDSTREVIDVEGTGPAIDEEVARALITAADAYAMMLERGSGAYASAIRVVAASESPVVFFCAAGKDRTGVFAAIVLGLLGVPDTDIVTDYALTAEVIEKIHVLRNDGDPANRGFAHLIGEDLANAYPASMEATIERVRDRWGGWRGYADAIGVEPEVLEALRARLLV